MTEPTSPAPGWYPDPAGAGNGVLRWWTGSAWTDDVMDHPWSSAETPVTPAPAVPVVTAAPAATRPGPYGAAGVPPTPYDGGADDGPARRARGPVAWLVAVAVVVLVATGVAAVVLLTRAANRSQLDMATVEAEIASQLTARSGTGTTVDCPDSVAIEAGTTFTCTATSTDGSTATVVVHQDDDQGNLTFGIPR